MARDKVKRAFTWIRNSLSIIDRTTLPGEILGEIRPTMDLFGWERLADRSTSLFNESNAAAPAANVNGPVTPEGVLRLVLHASVKHSDVGVSHLLWIDKDLRGVTPELVGVMQLVPFAIPEGIDVSLERWITIESGRRIRGRADVALIAGSLTLSMNFIDLPIGEYVPSL